MPKGSSRLSLATRSISPGIPGDVGQRLIRDRRAYEDPELGDDAPAPFN